MSKEETNIHVTSLTIYDYDSEYRKLLNKEEAHKFGLGLKHAGDVNTLYIFTDVDNIQQKLKNLEDDERGAFEEMVIAPINFLKNSGTQVKMIIADLTSFEDTKKHVKNEMKKYAKSRGTVRIYANLSGGHKIGSLAIYVGLLNIMKEAGEKACKTIFLYPYHAERKISDLPVINIKAHVKDVEYEKHLGTFATPINYENAKKIIMKNGADEIDAEKIINSFKKRALIKMENGMVMLTKRGRTLLALLNSL